MKLTLHTCEDRVFREILINKVNIFSLSLYDVPLVSDIHFVVFCARPGVMSLFASVEYYLQLCHTHHYSVFCPINFGSIGINININHHSGQRCFS